FCAVSAWAGDRDVFGSVNLCYRIRADQPGRSMPITPFLGDQKFDPETKRIMGVAFEMARAAVPRAPARSLPTQLSSLRKRARAIPSDLASLRWTVFARSEM